MYGMVLVMKIITLIMAFSFFGCSSIRNYYDSGHLFINGNLNSRKISGKIALRKVVVDSVNLSEKQSPIVYENIEKKIIEQGENVSLYKYQGLKVKYDSMFIETDQDIEYEKYADVYCSTTNELKAEERYFPKRIFYCSFVVSSRKTEIIERVGTCSYGQNDMTVSLLTSMKCAINQSVIGYRGVKVETYLYRHSEATKKMYDLIDEKNLAEAKQMASEMINNGDEQEKIAAHIGRLIISTINRDSDMYMNSYYHLRKIGYDKSNLFDVVNSLRRYKNGQIDGFGVNEEVHL